MRGRYPGDLIIILLVVLPLLVALPRLAGQLEVSWAFLCGVLSQVSGILALSTFLVAGMLSARVPRADRWFGGLVRVWHIHRLLGASAFLLIMLHVLLVAFASLPLSVHASVASLFPAPAHWPLWLGWGAFLLMLIFVAPTFNFYGRLHYQHWKRLHLLSAPALVLGLSHGLLFAPETALWWLLGVSALGAIVWRKGLSPLLARMPYRVDSIEPLAQDVVELNLLPEKKGITWRAGQFVYLTPMEPSLAAGYREEHPYTIASSSCDRFMRVGVKGVGDATQALLGVEPGSRVQIEGPYGTFLSEPDVRERQLWIGGGIGITPFVAGVREWRDGEPVASQVTLLYLADRPERAYYLEEMSEIAETHDGIDVYVHYFTQEGVLTQDFLEARCPDFVGREIHLCGPPGMIRHVAALLRRAGVPRQRIHTEAFDFL